MIFAFDFPREENGEYYRPYEHTDDYTFNGLMGFDKDYPVFGNAPPSIIELLYSYELDYQVVKSSDICKTDKEFYYLLETLGPPEGWLGTQENYNNTLLSGVSEQVLQATQNKKCKIILWSSNEGYDPFQNKIFDKIYEDLNKYNIPYTQFIFISGNLIIDTLHFTWMKMNGRDSSGIKCIPFNNEIFDFYNKMQPDVKYDKDSSERDKYFLLLNRMPRIHRMALMSMLHSKMLLENTLTSFPSEKLSPANFCKKIHLSQYFSRMMNFNKQEKSNYLKAWKDLEDNHFPMIVDVEEWDTNHYGTSVDWLYNRTFFSVVVESIYDDLSVFLDEKIWKPIYNYHPFVLVGCPNSLKKLREMGFRTFHPFIDESYDTEFNHGKRMEMVCSEVGKLCEKSFDELKLWFKDITPILEHNKDALDYHNKGKQKILTDLIREVS